VTFTKSTPTHASFSFRNPIELSSSQPQHIGLLQVADIYNHAVKITGIGEVQTASNYNAFSASLANNQFVLTTRTVSGMPSSFSISVFSPTGGVVQTFNSDDAAKSGAQTTGYATFSWSAGKLNNLLAKGIYPVIVSPTGDKTYLIKN
jgi:hypothetical protein